MSGISRKQALELCGGKWMRSKILTVLLALVLVAVPLSAACAAPSPVPPEEVITLTFAHFPPAPTFPCVSMEDWADKVEARTNGKVKIDTFPGGTLLGVPAMFDGVKEGVADIGCSCLSYEPGRFPLMLGMETPLPVRFPNAEVASRVLWQAYQEFQPAELADWKVITMYTAGPNHIVTIDPVNTLADLKGLELRATGAVVPIMSTLGASPVGLPQSEVPEALAKGVVNGYVSSLETILDFKYAETCHYATDWSPSIGALFAVVMNKDTWNSLPKDVQKVIDDLALEQSVWTGAYMDSHTEEAIDWAEKECAFEIVTISPGEKAKWDALIMPLVDDYLADMAAKGLPGEEYLDRIQELCEKYSK